jgi:hypothetical protein
MNADGTIEESSGEKIRITRTPVDLERPIFMGR